MKQQKTREKAEERIRQSEIHEESISDITDQSQPVLPVIEVTS